MRLYIQAETKEAYDEFANVLLEEMPSMVLWPNSEDGRHGFTRKLDPEEPSLIGIVAFSMRPAILLATGETE